MSKTIPGIHHITAIAGDPEKNIAFYTGVLGLRLVKITVNFDDPGSYHFYYGDGRGTPGTILTFFTWPQARRGRIGNGQVTATSFAVPAVSLGFWAERLKGAGVETGPLVERFGETVLPFSDPDGVRLELVGTAQLGASLTWEAGGVPGEFAIAGFHGATLSETGYERTAALLTETMGFRLAAEEQNRFRYETAGGGATRTVDVVCAPGGVDGRVAVGTVHHIAWRTPDDAEEAEWRAGLSGLGYNVSPVMDRVYFHSIYYREPGGVLFEIATDVPGFTADEPVESLGATLRLPPWLEASRARIEEALPAVAQWKKGVGA